MAEDTSSVLSSLIGPLKGLSDTVTSLKTSLSSVIEGPIKHFSSGLTELTGILADTAKEQPAVTKSLTTNLLSLGSVVTGISGQFTALAAPFTQFVQALSPGTMQLFALNLKDLNATIGTAVLPIVQEVSEALKEAAGIIKPTMAELAPIFRDLAHSILALLLDSLRSLMAWLKFFIPLLQALTSVIRFLTDVWMTINNLTRTFVEALKPVFDVLLSVLKNTAIGFLVLAGPIGWLVLVIGYIITHLNQLIRGMQYLIVVHARVAAVLMQLFGGGALLGAWIDKLKAQQKEKEGGVGGAIQDVALKGFEQISKDLALAAAYAGGAKKDTVEDLLPQIIEAMEQGRNDGLNFQRLILEKLDKLIAKFDPKSYLPDNPFRKRGVVIPARDPVGEAANDQLPRNRPRR